MMGGRRVGESVRRYHSFAVLCTAVISVNNTATILSEGRDGRGVVMIMTISIDISYCLDYQACERRDYAVMGIPGLLSALKSVTYPVHVSEYRGLKVGVDAYCW